MTTSRTSTRSTAKSNRSVLHTKKTQVDGNAVIEEPAAITDARLSRTRDSRERQALIRELAYQYSESRGFAPGHELEDWCAAEAEVDARLIGESRVC